MSVPAAPIVSIGGIGGIGVVARLAFDPMPPVVTLALAPAGLLERVGRRTPLPGAPAMTAFREAKIAAVQASLRGRDVAADPSALRCLTIGKIDLFGHTRSLLELGRLGVVPKSLPLADEFEKQLREFELVAHRINTHDPESWRDASADDLVRAVDQVAMGSEDRGALQ
jgi:hypothetical protein